MQQKSQTKSNAKLRTALENLRYRSCTLEDIYLLQSYIAGPGPVRPKLNDPRFKGVSIIIAFNAYRDNINIEASQCFAHDIGQKLVDLYSTDHLGTDPTNTGPKKQCKHVIDTLRSTNIASPELQETLWSLHPHLTQHHPGKLSLCVGMPVMIKNNEATECCVTNGAEAEVVSWTSRPITDGMFLTIVSASNGPLQTKFSQAPCSRSRGCFPRVIRCF